MNSFANPSTNSRDPRATWLRPELIARWPEIAAIVAVIIGFSTLTSSWQALNGSSKNYIAMLLTDQRMVHTILIESSILGLLLVLLHWRGWKISDFKISPTWASTGVGLLLIPA